MKIHEVMRGGFMGVKRFNARRLTALFLGVLLLLSTTAQSVLASGLVAEDSVLDPQIVHVGFFQFDGYHDMNASGEKSGYGYDFLQMIAGYGNFKYVYVGYQKNWEDMLEMLDDGRIDMLTYALKLPEYQDRFDFTEHSIGSSSALLTTYVTNTAFADNDYLPFNGMRVGMIEGANRKSALDAYAATKGITYTPVYYSDINSMKAALKEGKDIDAMVADELRVLSDEVIIDKFDTQNLYVMVKKGNTQLLNTLDSAIGKLNAANPGWEVELQNKYFLSEYSTGMSTTLSESQYIQKLASDGKTLKVLFNPARYPLSYYDNGEARGVLVDIFKQLASEYGLPYEFVKAGTLKKYYELRKNDEADIILDFAESTDEAEVLGYRLTSSYANADYSMVTANNFSGTVQTIAILDGSEVFENIAKANAPKAKLDYYNTFEDCMDAVKSGTDDCTYMYSITAQMFLMEDNNNRLKATHADDASFQFRLAVNAKNDMRLYALLNKATHNLSASDTQAVFNAYLVEAKQSYSLWNYFADNPSVMSALVIIVLLILVSFLLIQRKNSEKLEESNNALNASRDALEDALEAANEANASKTKFLSQMSHDIRTPLNGIIGMTRIAGDHVDDPERVTDALDKISQSSDHLLTLINDILDLSRIESGKMSMAHEPTDLPATINQCVEVLKSSVIDRDIRVISDIAPVDYPVVLTDALHVRQVLINIISNAVKFTPDGGKIIFRFQAHPDADHRVLQSHFEIADTGIGMSEDFQDHIFEAFVQADDSDARTQYKGSGLGMAIVNEFVEMLGGQIEIRSRMNAGTTICLDFPFEIDGDASALKKKEAVEEDAGGYEFADVRVLLVEDNNINMEIAEVMLESRGIIVETALNGQEAVERFNASEAGYFQCILMDIMMPVMNGYEAARAIRALERTDARTIPIIAMTANAFAEDVQAALDSGMNGHIAKPIDMDVLTGTIHDCIQREKED